MKNRLPLLDLLRWFLATYVIVFHFWSWTKEDLFWQTKKLTAGIIQYGYLSVDVFFIISGIAIASSSLTKSSSDFLTGRIKRLVPTFIFVSIIETSTMLWMYLRDNVSNSLTSIILVSARNLLPTSGDDAAIRNFVAWSLAIEVQFYVLVWLGIALSVQRGSDRNKYILNFSRVAVGILYLIGFAKLSVLSNLAIVMYLPYFILGANLWCFFSKSKEIRKPQLLDFAILIPILFNTLSSRLMGAPMPAYSFIGMSILFLMFGVILLSLKIEIPNLNELSKVVGNASYPLYLLGGYTSILLFTHGKESLGLLMAALIAYFFGSFLAIIYQIFLDKKFEKFLFRDFR